MVLKKTLYYGMLRKTLVGMVREARLIYPEWGEGKECTCRYLDAQYSMSPRIIIRRTGLDTSIAVLVFCFFLGGVSIENICKSFYLPNFLHFYQLFLLQILQVYPIVQSRKRSKSVVRTPNFCPFHTKLAGGFISLMCTPFHPCTRAKGNFKIQQ